MPEPANPPGLGQARILPDRAQRRLLALGSLGFVLLFASVALIQRWTRSVSVLPPSLPAGTYRPTPEERAGLKIETVTLGDPGDVIGATGIISADEDHSAPISPFFSGHVLDVYIEAGQHVERGQPLLRIQSADVIDARNTLASASAQRETAAAALRTAVSTEARQSELYRSAGGALKDYQQARSDLVAARSALQTAEAASHAARERLALLGQPAIAAGDGRSAPLAVLLRAPVSGIVATRAVAPGQFLNAGGDKPILTIADLSRVWLVAQLAESDAGKVRLGDPAEVTTPAYPGRVFHATIDNIGAEIDPTTHRLPVRATVLNPDLALKPQMFASFSIRKPGGERVLLVPSSAIIHEGDSARVWVADRNGLLRVRAVAVDNSRNGLDRVRMGLRPGERVVTSGALFVNEAGLGE